MIPDMNGLEVVRRVRRLIGEATPIIILTAYDWTDIEVEARAAGVTAFCAKPLFLSELRRVLAEPFRMEEQKEPTENAAEFAGKRLLVVEDNALNREIAVTMLEEAGFAVDTAENGKLAVEQCAKARPGTMICADGHSDAGHERLRGHARHPRPAGRRKGGPAHRRRDGERL